MPGDRLFGRAWRVQVGDTVIDSTQEGGALDVHFTVKRTLASRAGTCALEVYNLKEDHRNALVSRGTLVQVDAGYVDTGTAQLFRGDIRKASIVRENTDWTLKITAGDGEYAIRTARTVRSFSPNTSLETVFRAVAGDMGVGTGNLSSAIQGAAMGTVGSLFPAGTVLHGLASRELTRLCHGAGLEWSVQDGVLQLLPRGTGLQRTATLVSGDTGMIGSPEHAKKGVVKVKSLIQPGLNPGERIVVESLGNRLGQYRIEKTDYEGQIPGTDWYASLVCREERAA